MASETTTVVESVLPEYELVVIVAPESGEEGFEARITAVSNLITSRGGTVVNTERWGKRRLASPVKHHREGLYFLVRFKAGTQFGKEIDGNLRISEDVLRHILVRPVIRKPKVKEAKKRPVAKEAGTNAPPKGA
jgi:small subunit ribosomal protein S6